MIWMMTSLLFGTNYPKLRYSSVNEAGNVFKPNQTSTSGVKLLLAGAICGLSGCICIYIHF